MSISFSTPVISNASQLGGNQQNVHTAGLANGGSVVAWQSDVGGLNNTFFQRYDALGVPVGALTVVQNTTAQNMFLRDIAVENDGTFSILTQGNVGPIVADQRLFVTSYSDATGAQSGAQASLNLSAFGPNGISGAQLLPDTGAVGSLIVVASVLTALASNDLIRAVVSTTGIVTTAPTLATSSFSFNAITEAVEGVNGHQFAISSNTIVDTTGTFAATTDMVDIVSLSPGTFVVARSIAGSAQLSLSLFFGTTASISGYGVTNVAFATQVQGITTAGTQSFDTKLVDLGAGRILIVWVVDGGDSNPSNNAMIDGVYAQVYNMNTGGTEGIATLIRDFGVGPNDGALSNIAISADKMADGRVSLGLSFINGLSGFDVFNTILDARNTGVTLTATSSGAETFVGTSFDDTFTGVNNGDRIIGGAGIDTVAFGATLDRSVDLQIPGAFPTNTFILSGIENLTGNSGADTFLGDSLNNVLSGGIGNDTLSGRNGQDTLVGGVNDDILSGGNGADTLEGGAGIDILNGNADDDLLLGGTDSDRLLGGTGNDILFGGDADDRLFGDAGDDLLNGGAGNDILNGGAGDDEMFGGVGADILHAEDGADSIYGGADNDTIFAHAGVQLVDGGTGIDTLRLVGDLAPSTNGFHVDLSGVFDQLGTTVAYTRFAEQISGIENVTGSIASDFITGDDLVNTLRGGAGNDTLVSGRGVDILFGDSGADIFAFEGPILGAADQIRDFAIGVDDIGLVNGAFGDINALNIAVRLTINATATVAASSLAQLTFDNAGAGFGQLFFDADGNGAGVAVLIATLSTTSNAAIDSGDFVFI